MYHRRTININRVVKLLQGAARSGASIPEILDKCNIPRQMLDDPDGTIERDTFIRMMLLIMTQTQDEFLGFGQGRKSKPGTFSMMAHAVINCPNLGSAVERGIRFYDLFELSLQSRIERDGEVLTPVTYDQCYAINPEDDAAPRAQVSHPEGTLSTPKLNTPTPATPK